jgi:DNA polymerase I-like protein with 3'-5' exonuclease and polymerase domains
MTDGLSHAISIPTAGRMSCKDPNAQQIPRAGEGALAVRRLILPSSGRRFVKGDFSTIELAIMATLSLDRAMQQAIQGGADMHRLTASRINVNYRVLKDVACDYVKSRVASGGLTKPP